MLKLVFLADLHAGHRVGLCLPENECADGSAYRASTFQKRLFDKYHECATGPWHKPDYVILNGDMIDGQGGKNRGTEQWTTEPLVQIRVAVELARLWEPKRGYVVTRGSDYHVNVSGLPAEEVLARDLNAEPLAGSGQAEDGDVKRSHEVAYLAAEGVSIQVAHAMGFTRVWQYRSTAITREMLLAKIGDRMRTEGTKYPAVRAIFRAHVHFCWRVEAINQEGFVIPCWQGQTPYMLRGSASALPDIGFWGMEVRGDEFECKKQAWHIETVQKRPVIVLGADLKRGKRKRSKRARTV